MPDFFFVDDVTVPAAFCWLARGAVTRTLGTVVGPPIGPGRFGASGPEAEANSPTRSTRVTRNRPSTEATSMSRAAFPWTNAHRYRLATTTATTPRELLDAVRRPGVSVVRVASTRAGNVATHDRLNAAVADAL